MDQPTQTTDLRGAIESAVATADAPAPTPAPAAPAPAPAPAPAAASTDSGRPRDALGRFVPMQKEPPQPPTPEIKTPPPPTADAAAAAKAKLDAEAEAANRAVMRAPASFSPKAREHWAALPAEVQAEIVKRERDIQRAMQETAGARQFSARMAQILEPHLPFIHQLANGDPFTYVNNILSASLALRTGTPQFKAEMVAEIVRQFGVDIQLLDTALANLPLPQNVPGQVPEQQIQAILQRELAPVKNLMASLEQQRQAAYQQAYEQEAAEIQEFAPQAEFFEDVREIMADLVEAAAKRGFDLDLRSAYDQACRIHPEVRSVLESRQRSQQTQGAAAAMNAAAQRAKAAASSVVGQPAVGTPASAPSGAAASLRASLEEAIARHSVGS
ncbi:MAG: hypothetical protein RMK97_02015 [Sutterellaceae bacterium]|nr:hypothetical protein [Burkholderiaceae bacterium]MDW8429270.1 hypothetical protein [Sutterellaceae bacterium]